MTKETYKTDVEPTVSQSTIKKPHHDINAIISKEEKLKDEVIQTLISGNKDDIDNKMVAIEQLQKVREWHRHSLFNKISISTISIFFILVLLAAIPSNSLSLSTYGYLDINTRSVNLTLSKDLNWNGKVRLNSQQTIVFENFTEIKSSNQPQINLSINSSYNIISALNGADLTSLFIPKGSKIWVTQDSINQELRIDIATIASLEKENELDTVLTFKLYGEFSIGSSNRNQQTYSGRKCPVLDQNCQIPRLIALEGSSAKILSVTLPLNETLELNGTSLKNLSFSDFQLSPSPMQTLRCEIEKGRFQLSSHTEHITLDKGDCVSVVSQANRFSIVSTPLMPIELKLFGKFKSLLLGTPEFNNQQLPSVLNWILALPSMREIGALLVSIIGVIGVFVTTIGIKK